MYAIGFTLAVYKISLCVLYPSFSILISPPVFLFTLIFVGVFSTFLW